MRAYVVITPARDEQTHLARLAESLSSQTVPPHAWFIVDDGSRDGTKKIAADLQHRLSWCHVLTLPDRGRRVRGKGVVDAFYAAYRTADRFEFDAIAKVDADVSFGPTAFAELLERFRARPRLGICGGGIVIEGPSGEWRPDRQLPTTFVRGPMRVYRRTCFENIGGLVAHKGWDAIDGIKAMTLGWEVQRFDEVPVKHHRYLGDATGVFRSSFENGLGGYFMGSLFAWNLYEAVHFATRRPYVVRGPAMIGGYLWGMLKRDRHNDPAVIAFIRNQQRQLLLEALRGGWKRERGC